MAANDERSSLWRTPLSTPVRTNENGTQDLFRHSEKLLASAVSICRLKGSVECQTGGIITVCEEMQRLLRLAFSENARIEKEMKKQKLNYDEEISFLKDRVACLEEEKEHTKKHLKELPFDELQKCSLQSSKKNKEELPKQGTVLTKTKTSSKKARQEVTKLKGSELSSASVESVSSLQSNVESGENDKEKESRKENMKPEVEITGKENEGNVVSEDILMERNSEDAPDDVSVEICYVESPKESKIKLKPKRKKGALFKVGKRSVNDKEKSQNKNSFETEVFNDVKEKNDDADSSGCRKTRRNSKNTVKKADEDTVDSIMESAEDIGETLSTSVHLNPDTGLIETWEVEEEPKEKPAQLKPRKNLRKKETKKSKKDALSSKKNFKEDSDKGKISNKKQNSKSEGNLCLDELVGESPGICPGSLTLGDNPEVQEMPDNRKKDSTPSKSKQKMPAKTPEKEEALGDVGFLIDISSMITSFMSTPDTAELELPLMSARERADARKLAALFNLRVSIGNKVDNCSSLLLSKTSGSKMPKPGKLDNLLSQLSIAAAREAEKANSKSRVKRKISSLSDVDGGNDEMSIDSSQPKRNAKSLSRSKKARL